MKILGRSGNPKHRKNRVTLMKSIAESKVMKEGAKRRIMLPLKRKANVELEEESVCEDSIEDALISSKIPTLIQTMILVKK